MSRITRTMPETTRKTAAIARTFKVIRQNALSMNLELEVASA